MSGYTPMMQQYLEIKKQYQYCLLFYRLGDFYELFFEDAKIASKELELTLTGKDCGVEERAPMCGVPFHSADGYIAKLIQKGYKVAVCEQTEDPKQAKGLVKRDVIRIVTPGTVLDTNVLDESKNNYIVSICKNGDGYGIAGCDVTTGEFTVQSFSENESGKILDEIARINPSEIICNEQFDLREKIKRAFELESNDYNRWCYDYQSASICLCNHFGTLNLEGFGIEGERAAVSAAGALMAYLLETQKNALKHISTLRRMTDSKAMVLDASSRKNLELTATLKDGSKRGSLLWVLDKTKSALGARRLRKWVESPLISKDRINQRLDAVQALTKDPMATDRLRESLGKIYDIERLMTKTVYGTCNARDLVSLKCSFSVLPEIKSVLDEFDCEQIKAINDRIDPLEDVFALIDKHIAEEPPFSVREGGLIKKGVSPELDELRSAKSDGTKWLMELENTEKEKTGIKNLRVRFNKVFGYYIEVTNSYKDLVPDYYTRKQTLVNAERYITPELKQIEDKIIGADEKITVLEYDLFADIRDKVAAQTERISRAAAAVSAVDALASLASVALSNNYVRPNITEERIIDVKEGRHPVVEKMTEGSFIPNDIYLNGEDKRIDIITGPNMAGKSTYMRQCALIVLMAQTGSFVPAESAVIGITDRIFTRVGASDNLATGQSTFMVEMNEVANILNNATERSLLILDEIGRGTSTYDGLSIAWSVLEYIAKKIKARTLFATHYHELTELEGRVEGVVNRSVSVQENGEEVIFLRKIVDGGTDKSYGIHVASLAGVPKTVVKRANKILERLNEKQGEVKGISDIPDAPEPVENEKLNAIVEECEKIDINNITPMEAMQTLARLKEELLELKE